MMIWKPNQKAVLEDVKRLKGLTLEGMGKPIKHTKQSMHYLMNEKYFLTLEDVCVFANSHGIDPRAFFTQEASPDVLQEVG